jgi:CheY-like chemotaxis protein
MQKRVLVVDDDKDIQTLIRMVLTPPDYEVESAENGAIALEKLENGKLPDILLLDLMMPNMSGYELLTTLYNKGLHSSLSIVVMSADLFTRQQMDQMDIKAFLTKPFNINDLKSAIEAA